MQIVKQRHFGRSTGFILKERKQQIWGIEKASQKQNSLTVSVSHLIPFTLLRICSCFSITSSPSSFSSFLQSFCISLLHFTHFLASACTWWFGCFPLNIPTSLLILPVSAPAHSHHTCASSAPARTGNGEALSFGDKVFHNKTKLYQLAFHSGGNCNDDNWPRVSSSDACRASTKRSSGETLSQGRSAENFSLQGLKPISLTSPTFTKTKAVLSTAGVILLP